MWQPVNQSPDFTELGRFEANGVRLLFREHQVVAMYAYGFTDDDIVAEHLGIKRKYVHAIVAELKKRYGWRTRREMGRVYAAASGIKQLQ